MGAPISFEDVEGKRVQHQNIRAKDTEGGLVDDLDRNFRTLVDELEEAYYGTGTPGERNEDGWKHGVSSTFMVFAKNFDVQPTLVESKEQFDALHGALWALYFMAFHWLAQKVVVMSDSEYRYDVTETGNIDKLEVAKQFLSDFAALQGWNQPSAQGRYNATANAQMAARGFSYTDPIFDTGSNALTAARIR